MLALIGARDQFGLNIGPIWGHPYLMNCIKGRSRFSGMWRLYDLWSLLLGNSFYKYVYKKCTCALNNRQCSVHLDTLKKPHATYRIEDIFHSRHNSVNSRRQLYNSRSNTWFGCQSHIIRKIANNRMLSRLLKYNQH